MILPRRRLFGIGAALLAAPAIVRVASIMPVKPLEVAGETTLERIRHFAGYFAGYAVKYSDVPQVVLGHEVWFTTFDGAEEFPPRDLVRRMCRNACP